MPNQELLNASTVELLAPLEAIISQHGVRVSCATCAEEIMNGREVVVGGRTVCRGCAGEGYVRHLNASIERWEAAARLR